GLQQPGRSFGGSLRREESTPVGARRPGSTGATVRHGQGCRAQSLYCATPATGRPTPSNGSLSSKRRNKAIAPYRLPPRKISQVRRRLAFAGRHQQTVAAQHVVLVADAHELLALGTDVFDPDWSRVRVAAIGRVYW